MQSYNYTPEDVLWGQLGGCLEALDAGTTCIVDQAHMTYSADHGISFFNPIPTRASSPTNISKPVLDFQQQ